LEIYSCKHTREANIRSFYIAEFPIITEKNYCFNIEKNIEHKFTAKIDTCAVLRVMEQEALTTTPSKIDGDAVVDSAFSDEGEVVEEGAEMAADLASGC
jgi:hypothetical protein